MLNEFILLQAAAQSLNDYWGMIVVIVVFVVIGLILKLKNLFKTNELRLIPAGNPWQKPLLTIK